MIIPLDTKRIEDYRTFLRIKSLPKYRIMGGFAEFPDEYASTVGIGEVAAAKVRKYAPTDGLFDYQRDIAALAIRKQKFAVFADCGLGKTRIMFEFARHSQSAIGRGRGVLIVCPAMVVHQTIGEWQRFHPDDAPPERVRANNLNDWLADCGGKIGITNYEALDKSVSSGKLGALILDESSMLKSHYGKWGQECIRLGKGLPFKLCLTGTPAPNDRIEYANHAVFLDHFPTVNSFLARFFVNRGETGERWELKPHALNSFYVALSHWCIFLSNPAVYGWKDNCRTLPPINVHIHEIRMTDAQRDVVGELQGSMFVDQIGGIGMRQKLGRLAKGEYQGQSIATNKPAFIKSLVESFGDESTLIWCIYNGEQETMERLFPDAASIKGDTPEEDRMRMVDDFKAGRVKVLISKPKILGFGLNLQIATRQVFSGLQDSYESYYQAVKRSNRIGSTAPLNVHIPITDIEAPMVENVLRKARQIESDTREQEEMFRAAQA